MAVKYFLICVTILVFVEFLEASPARRQYVAITESSASASPVVTNDGTEWDDNDDFDVDGEGWFSKAQISSSPTPDKDQDYNEYEDYSRGNGMADFGEDDDEQEDDEEEHLEQNAEEDENSKNDSEFLFVTPKDPRLMLEDDDDQSGPIKVRHTGRNSYPRISDGAENSLDFSDEEEKSNNEHPYEFTIDEDDRNDNEDDTDNENDDSHKDDDSVEALPRQEAQDDDDDDDEDDLVSEGDDDSDMFDNPEEEAAEVIYGDHVFLY